MSDPSLHVTFVCSGNICRSPLAERLTSAWAVRALGANAAGVLVASAGTDALDGKPMDKRSAAALAALGGEPAGFAAQSFVPSMADVLVENVRADAGARVGEVMLAQKGR